MRTLLFVLAVALAAPAAAQRQAPENRAEIALSFAPVVREAAPAVVSIYAKRVVAERASPFSRDPFFRDLFRNFGRAVPRVQNALGSGVIVSPDGLVVSNYHVVGEADAIRVVLGDRREFDAQVVLADEASDLAVLRLQGASDLPTLAFPASDTVEVGDLVLAIGNPFGVGQTVSGGIVSALARSGLSVGSGRGVFIQTDAAVNPGNSGGALVDMDGRLVGINTAILSRSGGSMGIGFAIPGDLVQRFVEQAAAGNARFERPWAGLRAQPVDADLAEGLDMPLPRGVVVSELHPKSPFGAAGLRPGDVLTALDDVEINSPQELNYRLAATGIGARVEVTWLRDGAPRTAELELIKPPETPPRAARTISGPGPLSGLTVARINPAVTAELNLPLRARGVVVTEARGTAARVGLRPGDILVRINATRIEAPAQVARAAAQRVRNWEVEIRREGRRRVIRFRI